METNIIQFLQIISWSGVAGLFVYFILKPLISLLVDKINNKNGNLTKRLNTIENNHLIDIRNDMIDIKKDINRLQDEQIKMRERLVRLEVKINDK